MRGVLPKSPRHLALGSAIRAVRIELKLSQENAAFACGLDRSYYGAIERGEHNIAIGNLWKIADAFKVPASELLAHQERAMREHR